MLTISTFVQTDIITTKILEWVTPAIPETWSSTLLVILITVMKAMDSWTSQVIILCVMKYLS